VIHLQKILDQTNHYATEKTDCLAAEFDSDNDEIKNKINFLNMQQLINSISSIF